MRAVKIVLLFTLMSLSACATPPGKLVDSDFIAKQISLNIPITDAYVQLRQGFRYCGPESGGTIFVTHHGVPDCMPPDKNEMLLCDIYTGDISGRSNWILGRIELKPENGGTLAILKVQTYVANKDKIMKSWELFIRGEAKQVCP